MNSFFKAISIILLICMIFSFSSCSNKGDKTKGDNNSDKSSDDIKDEEKDEEEDEKKSEDTETTKRDIVPAAMLYDTFIAEIASPGFNQLESLLTDYCGKFDEQLVFENQLNISFYSPGSTTIPLTSYNLLDFMQTLNQYDISEDDLMDCYKQFAGLLYSYAEIKLANSDSKDEALEKIGEISDAIEYIYSSYYYVASQSILAYRLPAIKSGKAVVFLPEKLAGFKDDDIHRQLEAAIKVISPSSTAETANAAEAAAGYKKIDLVTALAIPYPDFVESITTPAFNTLAAMMQEACGDYSAATMKEANNGSSSINNRIKSYNLNDDVNNYIIDADYGVYSTINVRRGLGYIANYAKQVLGENSEKYIQINDYISALKGVFAEYDIYHPERLKFIFGDDAAQLDIIMNQYPALKGNEHTDNKPISVVYLKDGNKPIFLILTDIYINMLNIGFTHDMAIEAEKHVGYTREK